jgi:hypothetical protein
MTTTTAQQLFTVYGTDPDGTTTLLCQTTDEKAAVAEVERLNSWAANAGYPGSAHYS